MNQDKLKGHFFIIVGPSGVGKNTLIEKYMKENPSRISFPVSATTRPKRQGEREAVNYYFHTTEEFKNKIDENAFLEWAQVFGNFYGTLKKTVLSALRDGKNLIKDIDVQGALELKEKLPKNNVTTIFILPPSLEELESRIRERNLDNEDAISTRLLDARKELEHKDKFDILITNDNLEKAYTEFSNIIKSKSN